MTGFRKLVAVAMCLWLLFSGAAAYALASLEPEHEHEHMAMGQASHDAADHQHADGGLELYSQLHGQPGFDQLTSAWITAPSAIVTQNTLAVAPDQMIAGSRSATPFPPPGPPPRMAALHRGGGFPH